MEAVPAHGAVIFKVHSKPSPFSDFMKLLRFLKLAEVQWANSSTGEGETSGFVQL